MFYKNTVPKMLMPKRRIKLLDDMVNESLQTNTLDRGIVKIYKNDGSISYGFWEIPITNLDVYVLLFNENKHIPLSSLDTDDNVYNYELYEMKDHHLHDILSNCVVMKLVKPETNMIDFLEYIVYNSKLNEETYLKLIGFLSLIKEYNNTDQTDDKIIDDNLETIHNLLTTNELSINPHIARDNIESILFRKVKLQ